MSTHATARDPRSVIRDARGRLPRFGSHDRRGPGRRSADRDLSWLAATLAHSVRSGATLLEAMEDVARRPASDALSRSDRTADADVAAVVAATRRGSRLDDALADWRGRRHDDPAVALVVAACRFGHATGGDMASALDGVSLTLLDRVEAADEARALASQARSSATVLVALPVVGVVGFSVLDPEVGRTLLGTGAGRACLLAGVALDLLGALVMSRLVRRALR